MSDEALENLLQENRFFPPTDAFAKQANATAAMFDEARHDRLEFWAQQARYLTWATDFDEILDWSDAPFARWFTGGELNVAYKIGRAHV